MKHAILTLSIGALGAQVTAHTLANASNEAPEPQDIVTLEEVTITTPKEGSDLRQQPITLSLIGRKQLDAAHALSLKGVSGLVPNLFIPDYGSRLTSAVYIRGIGSRINSSAIGMYVDDMPMIDKSSFDFNFFDIERLDVLRGPQGTLYGHNAMGGIVRIYTRNPFDYQGTDLRISAASGNALRSGSLIHYHRPTDQLAFSVGFYTESNQGFWDNVTTGEAADGLSSVGGRVRLIYRPTERLSCDFSVNYDYSDEEAYPYFYLGSLTGTEQYESYIGHITNNRPSGYLRRLCNVGLNVRYEASRYTLHAITSFQALRDRMQMDQDFIAADIYTLEQRQRLRTINEEVVIRSKGDSRWQWVNGLNVMYQGLHTTGPVTFYGDGLRFLESNINVNMPEVSEISLLDMMGFQQMGVGFRGDDIVMGGTFDTPVLGAALYHQSEIRLGKHLTATLGLRLDYQHLRLDYHSPADVSYAFTMPNTSNDKMSVDLQDLESHLLYDGQMSDSYLRLLPKVALRYQWDGGNQLYASASMGQRSGGYNLQMFSDLLQGALKNDMMRQVQQGVGDYMESLSTRDDISMPPYIPDPEDPTTTIRIPDLVKRIMAQNMPITDDPTTDQVRFRPEYSWCYEIGTHLQSAEHRMTLDASLFLNEIRDQQIARFAASGFGRQMVNAGRSESYGLELQGTWRPLNTLLLTANYGYTHAKFTDYQDGKGGSYTGCYVPFVPQNTLTIDASYTHPVTGSSWLQNWTLGATYSGVGKIYWTESNHVGKVMDATTGVSLSKVDDTLACQDYYSQLGARFSLLLQHNLQLELWGRNLTGTSYHTMYFESASRAFCQQGKPRQIGIDLKIHF